VRRGHCDKGVGRGRAAWESVRTPGSETLRLLSLAHP
jgi:hypothetical protein